MSTPNILLIQADQHRFDCIGVNGDTPVQTPSLDRLAADGMVFTHAFCPIPICTPSRCSLMSGQWSTRHLSIANWHSEAPHPIASDTPTFSQALNDAGYFLGYVGKWGVHPSKSPEDFGFHTYVPERDYRTWRETRGLPPAPRSNGWFGEVDPHIRPEESRSAWGADCVIRLLERVSQRREPFFIRWDPPEPHFPNVVPEPYASLYDPSAIKPWISFPDDLAGKPYIQRQQRRTWKIDRWTWDDWAPFVAKYFGEITLLDHQIGRILSALDDLGLADETLVVYTSDHGDMCGAHGMIDKHYIMYDDVVRVPLIARWPGVIPPGTTCDAFVSGIDLAPTFCAAGGAAAPQTFQGESLLPLFRGEARGRDDIFAAYHGNQFGLYSQRMVRERRWKYIWNATAEDELYDLERDPGELHNLAAHKAHAPELRRLRLRLLEWMRETGDPLLNEWVDVQLREGLKV